MKLPVLAIIFLAMAGLPAKSENTSVGEWQVTEESSNFCSLEYNGKYEKIVIFYSTIFGEPEPSMWIEAPPIEEYAHRENVPVFLYVDDLDLYFEFSMSFAANIEYQMLLGDEAGNTSISELEKMAKVLTKAKTGRFSFYILLHDRIEEVISFELKGTRLAAFLFWRCIEGMDH